MVLIPIIHAPRQDKMKNKLSVNPSDLDGLTQVAHFDTFSPTYSDFMVNYKATDLKNICSSVIKCFHCLNVAKLIKQTSLSRQHKWDREGCAVVLNWEAAVGVEYMCWSREYIFCFPANRECVVCVCVVCWYSMVKSYIFGEWLSELRLGAPSFNCLPNKQSKQTFTEVSTQQLHILGKIRLFTCFLS